MADRTGAEAVPADTALDSTAGAISPADSLALLRLAADSARDAAVLDVLHDAEAPVDASTAELDLASAFDINVARYAEHPRVTFWLNFFQTRARDRMAVWLTRLPSYEPMIRRALAANDLPGDLVYLALIESGYSNTAVSRSKAVGMWQFMRPTGREYGLRVDSWVDERRDPIKATNAAARYLADLTRWLGSHYLAAAAYNGGPGTVMRGLRRLGDAPAIGDDALGPEGMVEVVADDQFFRLSDTPHLRAETRDYVPKLIAAAMIAKQPEKYGFEPIPSVEPFSVDSFQVGGQVSLRAVAKASGLELEQIVALNPHYIRRITPPGRSVWVRVPPGHGEATALAVAALPKQDRAFGGEHVIRKGETLSSIGRRYGASVEELIDLNPGVSSRSLRIGSRLVVPGSASSAPAAASTGRSAPASGSRRIHVVRAGETLGRIASAYRVSVANLRAWNGLGGSSLIRVGQRLNVGPPASASVRTAQGAANHVVRQGDTLSSIARRYGVSVTALMELNTLSSPHAIRAGERLKVR